MSWLSQNWIWVVFGVGVLLLLMRRSGGMGCGPGGHSAHEAQAGAGTDPGQASPGTERKQEHRGHGCC